MKISVLVLIYGIELHESKTIQRLLDLCEPMDNTQLILWNNGPRKISERSIINSLKECFSQVVLVETIENKALSVVYNDFISKFNADRYVLLDDDSTLSKEYIKSALSENSVGIGVPLISFNGRVESPSMNIRSGYENGPYNSKDRIVGIGSGLFMDDSVAKVIHAHFGNVFDTRFFLYAVDTTFFFRVRSLGLNKKIKLVPGFEHSLSRLEDESAEKAHFRKFERSYAIGLCTRFYFKHCKLQLVKIVVKKLLRRDTYYLSTTLKALWYGKHHRA